MKDFKSAFALLDGFEFASAQDRENALLLSKWVGDAGFNRGSGPFPLIIITGPSLSGKTTLLERCIVQNGWRLCHKAAKLENKELDEAVQKRVSLVVFEDQKDQAIQIEAMQALKPFVCADEWSFVPQGEILERTMGKCSVVVITGQSRDLARLRKFPGIEEWAIEIRLKAREAV